MWYYIGYEVEVEIEVNDKNEWNNGYWYGYGFEDVIELNKKSYEVLAYADDLATTAEGRYNNNLFKYYFYFF